MTRRTICLESRVQIRTAQLNASIQWQHIRCACMSRQVVAWPAQQASPHHIAIIIITLSFPLLLLPALPSNPDVHGGVDGFWLKA
jgi:hypothetical protein